MSDDKLLLVYREKVFSIDAMALKYVDADRKDQKLKLQIWAECYRMFEEIKHFDGISNYLSAYVVGYDTAEIWMRDIYEETIRYCMERYQPEKKKSFMGYLINYTKYHLMDAYKKMKKELEHYDSVVINTKLLAKNEGVYEDTREEDAEDQNLIFNDYIRNILTLILRFCYKQEKAFEDKLFFSLDENGKIKNIKQSGYYQMIYTEQIIHVVKLNIKHGNRAEELDHEQEVFLTIRESFMDYIMKDICRSYEMLEETGLKQNDDILHNGEMTEIKLPVQETIYTRYVTEILKIDRSQDSVAASISKYRAKFKEKYMLISKS